MARFGATGSPDKFPGSTLKGPLKVGGSKANRAARYSGNPGPVTRTAVARLSRTKAKLPNARGPQSGAKPVVLRKESNTYGPIS